MTVCKWTDHRQRWHLRPVLGRMCMRNSKFGHFDFGEGGVRPQAVRCLKHFGVQGLCGAIRMVYNNNHIIHTTGMVSRDIVTPEE